MIMNKKKRKEKKKPLFLRILSEIDPLLTITSVESESSSNSLVSISSPSFSFNSIGLNLPPSLCAFSNLSTDLL